ncbi:MAG TPA: NAD(P)H-binding protein [Bryobacteraceae bacterium]
MKTAVVAGATGMIGSELCRQLALPDSGFDRVVALTRRPLDFSYPNLTEQRADLGKLDDLQGIGPFDAAFCTLGTTIKIAGSEQAFRLVDYDYVVAFARFAKRMGVKTFVLLTSGGANAKSRYLYLRVKGEAETAVEALGFASLYIFQPSILMGNRREVRPAERIGIAVAKVVQYVLVGPLRKFRGISSEHVAGGMRGAALESKQGRTICLYDDIIRLSTRTAPSRV